MWCAIREQVLRRSTFSVVLMTVAAVGLLVTPQAFGQADVTVTLDGAPNPAQVGDLVTYTMNVENLGPGAHPEIYSNIQLPLFGFVPPGDDGYNGGCDQCVNEPDSGVPCGLGNFEEDGSGQWYIWCYHGAMAPGVVHEVFVEVPLQMPAPVLPVLSETAPTERDFEHTVGDWALSPASAYIENSVEAPASVVNDMSDNPTAGCNNLVGFNAGDIALVRRGGPGGVSCDFGIKALNAEVAGATGAVIMNNCPVTDTTCGGLINMAAGDFGDAVTIPAVFVTQEDGDLLEADVPAGLMMAMGGIVPDGDYNLLTRGVAFNNSLPDIDPNPDNDDDQHTLTVQQGVCETAPVASFDAPATAMVDADVMFTDTSTGCAATSWAWDFGDGGTSTEQSPTYAFAAAGTYTVTLTATNDYGSSDATADIVVSDEGPALVASFDAPATAVVDADVMFTDTSTGDPTTWDWDFGDGAGTSTEQNPTYAYTAVGTYTVSLTVGDGTDTSTATADIVITDGGGVVYTDMYYVAAAGAGAGAEGSFWLTDADINNAGAAAMNYQFWWLPRNTDNAVPMMSDNYNLGAGMSVRYNDLVTMLGADGFGAVAIYADSPNALIMTRTFNQPGEKQGGTFGQAIPGYHGTMATPSGTRVRVLFMTENDDFRSNFGVLNATAAPITVNVELFGADGVSLGTEAVDLPAFGNTQLNSVFADFMPTVAGYVDVWSDDGTFFSYGSVVDNHTSDPTTVLPQ